MTNSRKEKNRIKTRNSKLTRKTMEQHLGRPLKNGEIIHHINIDPTDIKINNLIILTRQEHASAHNSINKIIKSLMESGLVGFNPKTKKYENIMEMFKDNVVMTTVDGEELCDFRTWEKLKKKGYLHPIYKTQ